ncbi:LysR family transcriptional regulator [uncultured Aquitalea sp.]|uniref:LysR family transcriptional regulator n=1 Tax=uncultured Aquitalea sp. TaxID=540272 RepID=UPI0025FCCABB|nr:LysR family transcriptional regulator [uncultured Aquitalea sp.]
MIDDLRALAVFASTVDNGSFRGAAKQLGLSPSVVSHHVARLESRLGTALLYRSTRALSLTEAGALLYQHASVMLASAREGLDDVTRMQAQLRGTLKLTLSAFLARHPLLGWLAEFAAAHPGVGLRMDFSDDKQALIRDGIDLAIRVGPLEDSNLRTRRLFSLQRCLAASPALLRERGHAASPEALADWPWIGLSMRADHKTLRHAELGDKHFRIRPRVVVNQVDAACQLAAAGAGLATPPLFLAQAALESGALVNPLPGWAPPPLEVQAVWPAGGAESLARRLAAWLAERAETRPLV